MALLDDGQDVARRIFEPSYLASTGRGPDAALVLILEAISLEDDSLSLQLGHHLFDLKPAILEL